MSKIKTGKKRKPFTVEHIEKLRVTSTGRKQSKETRRKHRDSAKEQWKSEEFRKICRQSMKAYWADPNWREWLCAKLRKPKRKKND